MDTTKLSFNEFLKLPAAKQLLAALVIAISALSGVIIYQNTISFKGALNTKDDRIESLQTRIEANQEKCSADKVAMQIAHQAEIKKVYEDAMNYANARLAGREARMDKAIEEADRVIASTKRTKITVRNIKKAVSKIAENEK